MSNSIQMSSYSNALKQIQLQLFDRPLSSGQKGLISSILKHWYLHYPHGNYRCLAYILATADYETDRSFRPIEDKSKGKGVRYGIMEKKNGKTYSSPLQLYYRRGIVPLVWYENYESIGIKIGVDLLTQPELAMNNKISIQILVQGMMEGWFTSYRLQDFFTSSKAQWLEARKVIRNSERNQMIKTLALAYHAALTR